MTVKTTMTQKQLHLQPLQQQLLVEKSRLIYDQILFFVAAKIV